jgi:hypothetical protein
MKEMRGGRGSKTASQRAFRPPQKGYFKNIGQKPVLPGRTSLRALFFGLSLTDSNFPFYHLFYSTIL